MKRLFTFAMVGIIASLAFAQSKVTKSESTTIHMAPRVETLMAAKQMHADQLAKANAEQVTATSIFRRSATTAKANTYPSVKGTVMPIASFSQREIANGTYNPLGAAPMKATTQEGNVTITTDAHGIITSVTGVEPKYYQRSDDGTAYFYNNGMSMTLQSGVATIIEDGDNVYMFNPISRYEQGSWVKGTKSGNTITVATYQPLAYSASYGATISLRWGVITAAGNVSVADSHAEAFTFAVDGNTISLEGTQAFGSTEGDAYYMGAFWDDDNSNTGYGDAETVLTLDENYVAPSTDPVVLPDGVTIENWFMNAVQVTSSASTSIKNQAVNVAFDGNDVYVKGAFSSMPDSWFKGTISGTEITFEKLQWLGNYSTYDVWMIGFNEATEQIVDATATYSAADKKITFNESILANAAADRVYYLQWLEDVVLTGAQQEYDEPIINDQTATLPYSNSFNSEAEQEQVGVYDANEDGKKFTFVDGAARYTYHTTNAADDYIVFPGLPLETGKSYKISVEAKAYSATYPERLEVVCGKVAKASALNIPVIPSTDITWKEYETLTNGDFTVAESGTYFFAIHAISDADEFYLYVDNFAVKENASNAPVNIADLAVEPDATGANTAIITLTVPATTLGGDAITDDVTVTIKRDGEEIYSEDKAAGSIVTITDNVPKAGSYTYTAIAATSEGATDVATAKAWVGVDIPGEVENLTAVDKSTTVALTWDAPTEGKNGGIVLADQLTYNVYPAELVEFWGFTFLETDYDNPYFTGLTATNANVPFNTNEGEQDYTYFAVSAESEAGEGADTFAAVLIGAPYELPVRESFADAEMHYFWSYDLDENSDDTSSAYYEVEQTSDDDGGAIDLYLTDEGWISLESGKINLGGTVNPVVTFDVMSADGASVDVIVATTNGETTIKTVAATDTYAPVEASLLEFANEDWIRVYFKAILPDGGDVYLDNIKIYNQLDDNLAAMSISAPASVNAGDDINVNVVVENQGANAVEEGQYTVELFVNGEKTQTAEGPAVVANATASVSFTIATSTLSPAEMAVYANIYYAVDEDEANNKTATKTVKVKIPNYPTATDLKAESAEAGVVLTWTAPNLESAAPEEITEDFEDAESFAQEFGDWTIIDADGMPAGGVSDVDIPGVVAGVNPLAWFVVDDNIFDGEGGAAHSGHKYMSTMFNVESKPNDDWLISPKLYGGAQTVSFYTMSFHDGYGLEEIEVLFTTGAVDDLDAYDSLYYDYVPAEWTEISVELPEGAQYFAIRCVSHDVFMLLVDDVTFTPASATADLEVVGYNVYRNGEKINEAVVTGTTYTDADAKNGDSYTVTVVYNNGESAPCAAVIVEITGIEGVAVDMEAVEYYNLQGVKVANPAPGSVVIRVQGDKATKVVF